ncbi:6-hydroxy-D-nicotine oxidase [Xylariaceae sp. AK1471]|nr:6-hydroxy-D-nicotine oxidase [Xylariaceae sp. AK1471]
MSVTAIGAHKLAAQRRLSWMIGPESDLPTDDDFRKRPWSQTCWTPAACYITPSTRGDIEIALWDIKRRDAKFAVRGTGHSPNRGFSSTDGTAVVIDLRERIRKLRSSETAKEKGVCLSDDRQTVDVTAGSTWGEVYTFLEERGLCAMGPRDPSVGVVGFLLGGGYPIFPNLYGTGADCVKEFWIMVDTARSQVFELQATPDGNEKKRKLFKSLKGGGSNFGIVHTTEIDVFPAIRVDYTISKYKVADSRSILDATVQVQEAMEKDNRLNVITTFYPHSVEVCLLLAKIPAGDAREGTNEDTKRDTVLASSAFEPFDKLKGLEITDTRKTDVLISSLVEAMARDNKPMRRSIGTVTTKVSLDLYLAIYNKWVAIVKDLPEGMALNFAIQPVSPACVRAGQKGGGNIMGLEEVSQCWWAFTAEWQKEDDDAHAESAISQMVTATQEVAKEKDLLLNYISMNFANASQDVLGSYGAENVQTMREAAAFSDDTELFQRLQNDGFLLRATPIRPTG